MTTIEGLDPRSRIVTAADELFYERGFRAVGMDDLRAAAGVSLKRLYATFPSKEALAVEVLERRHHLWTEDVLAVVGAVPEPRARILAIYDHLERWFRSDAFRGCAFVNAFAELGAQSPEVARLARKHKARFQRFVAALVVEAGLPDDLAPQLMLLAEGAQTMAAISGDPAAAGHARAAAERLVRACDAEARDAAAPPRRG